MSTTEDPIPNGTTEPSIQQVLDAIRKVGADTDSIRAHLREIDAQLAAFPTSAEVDELRGIVQTLQSDMTEVMEFVHGDPPLKERLIALEENVAAFKKRTGESEASIAREAGVAGDAQHRDVARDEASDLVDESETRQKTINTELRTGIANLVRGLNDLEVRSLTLFALICITGAMALYAVIWIIGEVT